MLIVLYTTLLPNCYPVNLQHSGCKHVFLHELCYVKLFEASFKCPKLHVQIMRFTCCLNIGFNWKILKMSPDNLSDITLESVAARTDHYVNVFVRENIASVTML